MLHFKAWFWAAALTGAISFVLCVLWGLTTPETLHMHELLEASLPGFVWLSPGTFLLGLVESFFWGAYVAVVFVPLHNLLHRRWAPRSAGESR